MNIKEYKIWRFAYKSHEDKIYVPEGVKFYCFNKESSIESFNYDIAQGYKRIYPNQRWIAVIPWSEEIERMSHNFHYDICGHKDNYTYIQSLALQSYNINNKYMIWFLEQIYPLSEDWPETEERPTFKPQYIKVRLTDVPEKLDIDKIIKKELELPSYDELFPIGEYFKLDRVSYGGFHGTNVIVKHHEISNNDSMSITNCYFGFHILHDWACHPGSTKVEPATKEEFDAAVQLVLSKI